MISNRITDPLCWLLLNSAVNQNRVSPRLCVGHTFGFSPPGTDRSTSTLLSSDYTSCLWALEKRKLTKIGKKWEQPSVEKSSSKVRTEVTTAVCKPVEAGQDGITQHHSFALWLLILHILHLRVEPSTIFMRFNYAWKWKPVWNYLVKGETSQY